MSKIDRGSTSVAEGAEQKRVHKSPQVEAPSNDKWDWLYKVGVKKVMEQKRAGRQQEEIIIEREPHEYTFQPNKPADKSPR
jgi:hypothetical protein